MIAPAPRDSSFYAMALEAETTSTSNTAWTTFTATSFEMPWENDLDWWVDDRGLRHYTRAFFARQRAADLAALNHSTEDGEVER